jgi:hypothetical protein
LTIRPEIDAMMKLDHYRSRNKGAKRPKLSTAGREMIGSGTTIGKTSGLQKCLEMKIQRQAYLPSCCGQKFVWEPWRRLEEASINVWEPPRLVPLRPHHLCLSQGTTWEDSHKGRRNPSHNFGKEEKIVCFGDTRSWK